MHCKSCWLGKGLGFGCCCFPNLINWTGNCAFWEPYCQEGSLEIATKNVISKQKEQSNFLFLKNGCFCDIEIKPSQNKHNNNKKEEKEAGRWRRRE